MENEDLENKWESEITQGIAEEVEHECDDCLMENDCLFEDQFVLVPIAKGINIDMFSDFYISGTGFLCAKKPYMIVLYDEYIDKDGNIKTEDIVGVVKRDNKAYIKINLGA